MEETHLFRVTRDADVAIAEDEAGDLLETMEKVFFCSFCFFEKFHFLSAGDKTAALWSCCAGCSAKWRHAKHFSAFDGRVRD